MIDSNNPPGNAVQLAPNTTVEVVEKILGPVEWTDTTTGYCECPGRHHHTNQNGRRDCIVYLDHVPTLYCVHGSCRNDVADKNRELRSMSGGVKKRLSKEDKLRIDQARCRQNIRLRAANSRDRILESRWTLNDILRDSPVKVPEDPVEHSKLLLGRFHHDDVVWIGDKYDSGIGHAGCFRTAHEWLEESALHGPLICPATFKPGVINRANENVVTRRFLVVESDTLDKDEVGAIFRWLRDKAALNLVAIVDTAGKSLHAWFDYPAEEVDDLKLVLPVLGCDPKLFTASQPVRLPGCLRGDRYQKLVYLGEEGSL